MEWNRGDAVVQFYYQPIFFKDCSFGFNFDIYSVYSVSKAIPGGGTSIGEGFSLGFRLVKNYLIDLRSHLEQINFCIMTD